MELIANVFFHVTNSPK